MAENIANLVATLLNGAIDSDDTSMVVDSATGFPEANFRLIVQDSESDDANREIVLVTAKASTTFTITRGQEGTTGVAHGDNSYVAHVLTAGALEAFVGTRAFIGCIAKRVSGTLASTGSYQPVPLNGEDKDTDGYHSTSVNPSRITIPAGRAGTYLVLGSFYGADTASYISLRKNGTTHLDRYGITGDDGIGSTHALVDLAEGDYLELVVNSGSTTINAAYLEVMLIGALVVPDSDADEFVGPFNPYDATEPSLAQGVNTAYFQKFVPRRSVTIRNVTFRVITQAGNLDFGIYDDAMTRLGSTGSFACPAPSGENNRALTAPVTLVRGRTYYFACATDSATYRTTGIARTTSVMLPVTSNVRLLGSQTNALPLPATAAPNWENGSTTPRASMIFY